MFIWMWNKMDSKLFRRFRLSVSSVPQDYFLLDRTIEENIVLEKLNLKLTTIYSIK